MRGREIETLRQFLAIFLQLASQESSFSKLTKYKDITESNFCYDIATTIDETMKLINVVIGAHIQEIAARREEVASFDTPTEKNMTCMGKQARIMLTYFITLVRNAELDTHCLGKKCWGNFIFQEVQV